MTATSPSSRALAPLTRGRVLLLLAIVLTALNLRTAVTGFSAVAETTGFGPTVIGAVGTVVTACFAFFGFTAPLVTRRLGLERTAAIAVGLTTVGIVVRSLADTPFTLIAASVVAFAGVGASNVIVIPLVKQHFPDRIKSISTLYMVLLQVGQFAAPLLAVPLALTAGWPLAVGIWAVPTGIAAVLWFVLSLRSRPTAARPAAAVASGRGGRNWGLVALFGATSFHVYALVTWLPAMFVDAGIPLAAGAGLLALFSSLGLLAAFVVPAATIRMRSPFLIVVVCAALLAIGYVGLLVAPAAGAAVWAVALGLGVSTFPLCLTLVNLRAHDAASASALSGRMQGIGYAIACVAPLLLGVLFEATGSWTPALVVLLVSLAGTIAAGWSACVK